MVEIYRKQPGNYANAARRASCSRLFAKRLYEGPPYEVYPWARPIRLVLEEEELAARAQARQAAERAQAEADGVREKARAEAIDAAAQEKQMLKVARGDVLSALVIAAELAPTMRVLGRAIAEQCKPGPDGSPPAIAPALAMALLTRHATVLQKAIGAAEVVIQLSRLDRGASTANVAIGAAPEMTLDAALEELEALDETLTAARARGPRLLPRGGGAGAPEEAPEDEPS